MNKKNNRRNIEFSYREYTSFIKKISDKNKYKNVTLNEFNLKHAEIPLISLRHDVDRDIQGALEMAAIEHRHDIRSTYFILHTAEYYGETKKNYVKHREELLPLLKKLQNEYQHEIGWHNDLVTLDVVYGVDPRKYLQDELTWLRDNGISISGTAGHGSLYCHKYNYLNQYFFKELQKPVGNFVNNEYVTINGQKHQVRKASLSEHELKYDAYHLDNTHYFSDSSFLSDKNRWHPYCLKLENFIPGDKVIILTHPQHWNKSP